MPACLPLLLSFAGPLQWVLVSGLAPAPLIGLLAAVQVERGRGYGHVIAAASLPGLVLGLFLVLGLASGSWPREEMVAEVSASLEQVAGGAEMSDMAGLQELVEVTLRLMPGMAYISLLLMAVFGYRVAQSLSVRTGIPLPRAVPLRQWRLWDELIWVLVGALVLMMIGAGSPRTVGVNAALVMSSLYAVQGLASLRHLMWRLGAHRFLEAMVYVLLAFTMGVSLPALALAGLLDTWFDWRRLGHRQDAEETDQEIDS